MRKLALAYFLILLLGGCTQRAVIKSPMPPGRLAYSPGDKIRIIESADGAYGTHTYRGSGRIVAGRVLAALQARYADVRVLPTTNESDALASCRSEQARFLIEPSILHWEDRATPWSGIPDRLQVQLTLRDVASNAVANSLVFEATSGSFVFVDRAPEALLDKAFERAVVDLLELR